MIGWIVSLILGLIGGIAVGFEVASHRAEVRVNEAHTTIDQMRTRIMYLQDKLEQKKEHINASNEAKSDSTLADLGTNLWSSGSRNPRQE